MSEKLSIKLSIGGYLFPITIDPSKEEMYRKAAQTVDRQYAQYRESYSKSTLQECALLVAFQFCFMLLQKNEEQDESPIMQRIEEMMRLMVANEQAR